MSVACFCAYPIKNIGKRENGSQVKFGRYKRVSVQKADTLFLFGSLLIKCTIKHLFFCALCQCNFSVILEYNIKEDIRGRFMPYRTS